MKLLLWTDRNPKRSPIDSQLTPCQLPMMTTAFVPDQNMKVSLTLSTVELQSVHSMPVLGKICKGQKSCRITVLRPITAILLLLPLTGQIYYRFFNKVRLLFKILLSNKVGIILMKPSWTWRLYQESVSKNLLEIKLLTSLYTVSLCKDPLSNYKFQYL